MKLIKITVKEAEKIAKRTGYPLSTDYDMGQRTYYATNEERSEVWEFDTKGERDKACE